MTRASETGSRWDLKFRLRRAPLRLLGVAWARAGLGADRLRRSRSWAVAIPAVAVLLPPAQLDGVGDHAQHGGIETAELLAQAFRRIARGTSPSAPPRSRRRPCAAAGRRRRRRRSAPCRSRLPVAREVDYNPRPNLQRLIFPPRVGGGAGGRGVPAWRCACQAEPALGWPDSSRLRFRKPRPLGIRGTRPRHARRSSASGCA